MRRSSTISTVTTQPSSLRCRPRTPSTSRLVHAPTCSAALRTSSVAATISARLQRVQQLGLPALERPGVELAALVAGLQRGHLAAHPRRLFELALVLRLQ